MIETTKTTNSITKGEGKLGTIYDRLRKRSSRRNKAWSYNRDTFLMDGPIPEIWSRAHHSAYVAGVRDALQAVEQETRTLATALGLNINSSYNSPITLKFSDGTTYTG